MQTVLSEAVLSESVAPNPPPPAIDQIDVMLVKWEEFALCLEEHFHALEMFKRKPNGKPMGHR